LPRSSGFSSRTASSLGLEVMAPNRQASVSLSSRMVRSGSGFPSAHQNSQPISPWTYSASRDSLSRTIMAASTTSLPTPSPGSTAILYLGMRVLLFSKWRFSYYATIHPQVNSLGDGHLSDVSTLKSTDFGLSSRRPIPKIRFSTLKTRFFEP